MRAIICRMGHCMEEAVVEELTEMGIEVWSFTGNLQQKDYDTAYAEALIEYIQSNKSSMVWSIGFLPVVSRVCRLKKLPYISWEIGESWNTLYSETVKSPWNFLFLAEEEITQRFWRKNPGHIFSLSPGIRRGLLPEAQGRVGICNPINDYPVYYLEDNCSEYMKGYIRGMIEAQKKVYGYYFIPDIITGKKRAELGKLLSEELKGKDYRKKTTSQKINDFIYDSVTRDEREEVLDRLMKTELFHEGEAICDINVNITSRKCKTGIPYEMLRVMAAGGFVITNYQEGIASSFQIGEEIIVYESMKDLEEKIWYYLEHTEERKRIAENGKMKVEKDFRLLSRLEDIFYVVTEELGKSKKH